MISWPLMLQCSHAPDDNHQECHHFRRRNMRFRLLRYSSRPNESAQLATVLITRRGSAQPLHFAIWPSDPGRYTTWTVRNMAGIYSSCQWVNPRSRKCNHRELLFDLNVDQISFGSVTPHVLWIALCYCMRTRCRRMLHPAGRFASR